MTKNTIELLKQVRKMTATPRENRAFIGLVSSVTSAINQRFLRVSRAKVALELSFES